MQYASGSDFIDLAAFYTYARFRPQFTFGLREDQFYRDYAREQRRRELSTIGLMTYPLDRVNSVEAGIGTTDRKIYSSINRNPIRFF